MTSKPRIGALLLVAVLCLALCGCGRDNSDEPDTIPKNEVAETAAPEVTEDLVPVEPTPEAMPSTAPIDYNEVLGMGSIDDVKAELNASILDIRQPRTMDISGLAFSEHPELDIKNLYYGLLSENRELCYAYDLTASISDGLLNVSISFMPYVTGEYPEGFEGINVYSLTELIAVAEANLGENAVNIRIADKALSLDDMNRALQQAGGGYIICSLNNDATAIVFRPDQNFTMEESLAYIEKCGALAGNVISQYINEKMSEMEKARALYGYLTENVKYDFRYYSDKASMPYHSRTAYGALYDDLAICGGYSHALKLLFEQAGIACYNVSGNSNGEDHLWSIANIDGQWLYFDATADRGVSPEWWKYCGVTADTLTNHVWNIDAVNTLTGAND